MSKDMKIINLSVQRTGTKTFTHISQSLEISALTWVQQCEAKFDIFAVKQEYSKIVNHPLFIENQSFADTPFWDLKLANYIRNNCIDVYFVYLIRPFKDWFRSMVLHSMGMTFDEIEVHAYYYRRTEDVEFLKSLGMKPKALNILDNYTFYKKWYRENHISTLTFLSQMPDKLTFIGRLNNENVWEEMFKKFNVDTTGVDLKKKFHQSSPERLELVKKNNKHLNKFYGSQLLKNRN